MIFTEYSEQRSFPEYIDCVFQDLVFKEEYSGEGSLPITCWEELMDLVLEGYCIEFCEVPEYILNEDYEGKNKRRFKKFIKKAFEQYGEEDKASEVHKQSDILFEEEMTLHEEDVDVLSGNAIEEDIICF